MLKLSPPIKYLYLSNSREGYDSLAICCSSKTFVFIDSGIENYEVPKMEVFPGLKTFLIEPESDSNFKISQVLDPYHVIDSVHIVSYGEPATLHLSSSQLRLTNIDNRRSCLTGELNALSNDAQILLNRCRTAECDRGLECVQALSETTGSATVRSKTFADQPIRGDNWKPEGFTNVSPFLFPFGQGALVAFIRTLIDGGIASIKADNGNTRLAVV